MRRKKVVRYKCDNGVADVKITIETKTKWLTRGEADTMACALADDAMRSLATVRYVHADLCKIAVK